MKHPFLIQLDMPICTLCKEHKTGDLMCKNNRTVSGLGSWCRSCRSEKTRANYDYLTMRSRILEKKYGFSHADYLAMLEKQGGVCAICGEPPRLRGHGRKRREIALLHIDHDHETGVVRGLLCVRCNTVLGQLEDRRHLLPVLEQYLESRGYAWEPSGTAKIGPFGEYRRRKGMPNRRPDGSLPITG